MKRTTVLGLAGAAVAAIGLAVVLVGGEERASQPVEVGTAALPELADRINDVATLVLATSEETVTLTRTAAGWAAPDKDGYPARPEVVRRAVAGAADLVLVRPMTANPERYARLSVTDPGPDASSRHLRLLDEAGREIAALIVGETTVALEAGRPAELYVRRPGETQSWLARGTFALEAGLTDWLALEVVEIPRNDVMDAVVSHADGEVVTVRRDPRDAQNFSLSGIPEGRAAKSDFVPNSVAAALAFLDHDDVRPAADVDLSAASETVYRTWRGLVVTARVIELDGAWWMTYAAAVDPDRVAAEAGDPATVEAEAQAINDRASGWLYRIPDWKAGDIAKRWEALTDPIEEGEAG